MKDWDNYNGPCVCGPDGPFHKFECPCSKRYREKLRAELEACETTDEDATRVAAALVLAGWEQRSRKYRRVGRGACVKELDLKTFEAFRAARIAAGHLFP